MKEVNFSYFTSVRFLGLGLKILFHKNKEIKRMLSKKMAFSLMSLITLLAFAFVAPTAMAGDFGVAVDVTGDVSSAADFQELYPADDSLEVTVKFDQAVLFDAAKAFVTTYDKDGVLIDIPVATGAPAKTVASKEIILTIPVTTATVRLNLKIAKGIASADPINADTSAALDFNIYLVDSDLVGVAGVPTVYSIRRADNPLLPVTAATVQVIVTLSEQPKEFLKGNLSISDNATISKEPEALTPIAEDPNRFRNLRISDIRAATGTTPPPMRVLYDTADPEVLGIHAAIVEDAAAGAPSDEAKALNDAVTAYNLLADAAAVLPFFTLRSDLSTTVLANHTIPVHRPFKTYTLSGADNATPTAAYADGAAKEDAITEALIAAADNMLFDRTIAPTKPVVGDGDFVAATELYGVLKEVNDLYKAEDALHKAYMAAVEAEEAIDEARDSEALCGSGRYVGGDCYGTRQYVASIRSDDYAEVSRG